MTVILLVWLAFVLVVLLIDWMPQFYTWQSRIKIGQFARVDLWKQKVASTASAWLKRTPTITVTDNTRLIIIDIIKGNYKKTAIQSWQQAALVLGLNAYADEKDDTKVRRQLTDFNASKLDANGNWKKPLTEVDEVLLAYALSKTTGTGFNAQAAFGQTFDFIKSRMGQDGTIGYRKHTPNQRLVDTIGFICPFLVRYGVEKNNEEAVQLALGQLREFNKHALLNDTFIPCHSYDIHTKLPCGLFGWGRGMAWYAIGLMDSWLELPGNHPDKPELTQMVMRLAQTIIRLQKENGSWSWLLMDNAKQSDSSATAVFSWFLTCAAQLSAITADCNNAKGKALNYLKDVTRRDGAIDFSQGDTKGVGVYSQKFNILPFTQGFCLRALHTHFNQDV